jgi:hypothetical protein
MKTKLFLLLALCASTQSHGMEFLRRVENGPKYPAQRLEMHDGFAVTANEKFLVTSFEYGGVVAGVLDGACCPTPGGNIVHSVMVGYCMFKAMGAGAVAFWRCCDFDGDPEKKDVAIVFACPKGKED